eukprot:12911130-Prorocentrum_lima.AAC.1
MAIKSITSQVVFMCVALLPPNVTESSLGRSCSALDSNFFGGALTRVPCDDCPCHEELSDPGPRV